MVCAQYVSFVMGSGSGGAAGGVRAEQIGDYRIEYQRSNSDSFDLQTLRDMLNSMHGDSAYTVTTLDERRSSSIPSFDSFDPDYDEVLEGEIVGIAAPLLSPDDALVDYLTEEVGS